MKNVTPAKIEGSCSYCGRSGDEVSRLVSGPEALVCDRCVARLPDWLPAESRRWLRWVNFSGDQDFIALPWRMPTAPTDSTLVIFQHLPKSGGTTIDHVLAAAARRCGRGYLRFGVGKGCDPPVWIAPGWTGAWGTVEQHVQTRAPTPAFTICSGHFPHGVHGVLDRPARYITLVRDPVAREISSYNYHYQNGVLDESESLGDLLSQGRLLDNPQTRMLAGPAAMRGSCTEDTFNQAQTNLERDFAIVGVTEHAHDFLGAVLGLLAFPAVRYVHRRVTAIRRIESPDATLTHLLQQVHAWDLRLHRTCQERWQAFVHRHRDSIPRQVPPVDNGEVIDAT